MFDEMLRELIDAVPGARGAVFCAPDGEAVSCVGASGRSDGGERNDFDLRVAGAQLALPLDLAQPEGASIGPVREFVIIAAREKMLVHMLPERYYIVLCLHPEALVGRGLLFLRSIAERVAVEI